MSTTLSTADPEDDIIVTKFDIDENLMVPLESCMNQYDEADSLPEWELGLISSQAVIYGDGLISKCNAPNMPTHRVSSKELQLCKAISQELEAKCSHVMLISEADSCLLAFFITAQLPEDGNEVIATEITPALIRSKFAGTIFPPATITVEPLQAEGIWWEGIFPEEQNEEDSNYLAAWHSVIKTFQEHPDLRAPVFVEIGDYSELNDLDKAYYPPGTEMVGCAYPRMALALTAAGSIVGLFGDIVCT